MLFAYSGERHRWRFPTLPYPSRSPPAPQSQGRAADAAQHRRRSGVCPAERPVQEEARQPAIICQSLSILQAWHFRSCCRASQVGWGACWGCIRQGRGGRAQSHTPLPSMGTFTMVSRPGILQSCLAVAGRSWNSTVGCGMILSCCTTKLPLPPSSCVVSCSCCQILEFLPSGRSW